MGSFLALANTPASAQDRDFCADRPGQTTPPCTLAAGKVMIETALAGWSREHDDSSRTDTLVLGASLLRAGVTPRLEVQLGWSPLGVKWTADKATGTTIRQAGSGDLGIGFTYGIAGPNGPMAVQGFVVIPTGGVAIGAGGWGAGLRFPLAAPIGSGAVISLTPEIDAMPDFSAGRHHLVYGGAAGLGFSLTHTTTLGADVAWFRDNDPDAATTRASGGLSLAWQVGKDSQIDIGGSVGLNHETADGTAYVGIAHRF